MSFHSGRKQCARAGMFVDKTSHTQTEKRGTFAVFHPLRECQEETPLAPTDIVQPVVPDSPEQLGLFSEDGIHLEDTNWFNACVRAPPPESSEVDVGSVPDHLIEVVGALPPATVFSLVGPVAGHGKAVSDMPDVWGELDAIYHLIYNQVGAPLYTHPPRSTSLEEQGHDLFLSRLVCPPTCRPGKPIARVSDLNIYSCLNSSCWAAMLVPGKAQVAKVTTYSCPDLPCLSANLAPGKTNAPSFMCTIYSCLDDTPNCRHPGAKVAKEEGVSRQGNHLSHSTTDSHSVRLVWLAMLTVSEGVRMVVTCGKKQDLVLHKR
uniref:Uncharacterized protein n=1 Tax=Timema poppense TaxID=170557 RepID=A0A7R9H8G9_TIMPO|nr:unnamed protein product [Timema poppensis]